jgi:hypothetical protein
LNFGTLGRERHRHPEVVNRFRLIGHGRVRPRELKRTRISS